MMVCSSPHRATITTSRATITSGSTAMRSSASISTRPAVALHVRLHIGRRHLPYRMPQSLQLARPVMRRSARLDPDQARRQLLKERQNVAPPQLTADNHLAFRTNAMDLKHRL